MSQWIAVILSLAMAVLGAGVAVGVIKNTLQGISKGQETTHDSLAELTKVVTQLVTTAAVNSAQHDELSRRISMVEGKLGEQGESIRILRTRSHMNSNKLMELDPAWKPYRKMADDE